MGSVYKGSERGKIGACGLESGVLELEILKDTVWSTCYVWLRRGRDGERGGRGMERPGNGKNHCGRY